MKVNLCIILSVMQSTYDITSSYEENYQKGPFIGTAFPPIEAAPFGDTIPKQNFLGFPVHSRLGIPAGPLLNANWILAYAAFGFDLLVYKTVRTIATPSHPAPNCVFLQTKGLLQEDDFGKRLLAAEHAPTTLEEVSITNSFGMPSRDPKIWQADVEKAKSGLALRGAGQVLIVSVSGTPEQGDLASDYAKGAALAVEAGADIIEINLSCPNVVSGEGSIYADPHFSSKISKAVKQAIGPVPLIIKIGYLRDKEKLAQVVKANVPYVNAISGLNTLSFEVVNSDGTSALPGRLRSGVCGSAIRGCAMDQARRLITLREKERYDFSIVGVGGVMTAKHIQQFLDLGLDAVMSATGAMWNPHLAYQHWKDNVVCDKKGI
ncbi:MAG: dihydroorotate dehydrogenase [Nitrospirota bacterium]